MTESNSGTDTDRAERAEEHRSLNIVVLLIAAAVVYLLAVQYYEAPANVKPVRWGPVEKPLE